MSKSICCIIYLFRYETSIFSCIIPYSYFNRNTPNFHFGSTFNRTHREVFYGKQVHQHCSSLSMSSQAFALQPFINIMIHFLHELFKVVGWLRYCFALSCRILFQCCVLGTHHPQIGHFSSSRRCYLLSSYLPSSLQRILQHSLYHHEASEKENNVLK
jgi:hypothetical protein